MSSTESAVKSVSENNVVIKPTGILKVESSFQDKSKKKIHFSERNEGIIIPGRLQKYQAYLAFYNDLERTDKTRLPSGIFFSFDKKYNLRVLVVHKEEENKITEFNLTEHSQTHHVNETLVKKYIFELSDPHYQLFQKDNKRSENLPLEPVNLGSEIGKQIRKIIAESIKHDKVTLFTADVSSTILRQERKNLFADYTWTLILSRDLDNNKAKATVPGFYIYPDKDAKIYALVKHTNKRKITENGEEKEVGAETETICLSDIAQTVDEQTLVNDIAKKDLNELKSKLLALVLPHCKKCFIKIPVSHDEYHPLHVFQFSTYNKANDFVGSYFFDESIRFIITLEDIFFEKSRRNVVAENDIEKYDVEESIRDLFLEERPFLERDYDKNDMVFYFYDRNTPKELLTQIKDKEKEKGSRVISIEVTGNANPIDITSVIDKIKLKYAVSKEKPVIAWIKAQLALRAKSKTTAGKEHSGRQQKTILSELIQMYIIINSRSQSCRDQQFISWLNRRATLFYKPEDERTPDDIIENAVEEIKKLYISSYSGGEVQSLEVQKEKESVPIDESNQIICDDLAKDVACITEARHNSFFAAPMPLEVGTPKSPAEASPMVPGPALRSNDIVGSLEVGQAGQEQTNGSVAEDSKIVKEITEHSVRVTTLVETKVDDMDGVVDVKKAGTTPFWLEELDAAQKHVTQQLASLTMLCN